MPTTKISLLFLAPIVMLSLLIGAWFTVWPSGELKSTTDWKTWSSSDYKPQQNPLEYQMGITFQYPPHLKDGGYQDMGGGLLLYSDIPDEALYIDCLKIKEDELDQWFGLSQPLDYYTVVSKERVSLATHNGLEAVLEVKADAPEIRRWDRYRLLRFYLEKDRVVCEIEASLNTDRTLLEKMISSFAPVSH